jgi:hypothetical protein
LGTSAAESDMPLKIVEAEKNDAAMAERRNRRVAEFRDM